VCRCCSSLNLLESFPVNMSYAITDDRQYAGIRLVAETMTGCSQTVNYDQLEALPFKPPNIMGLLGIMMISVIQVGHGSRTRLMDPCLVYRARGQQHHVAPPAACVTADGRLKPHVASPHVSTAANTRHATQHLYATTAVQGWPEM
jgi:hypothetical protein